MKERNAWILGANIAAAIIVVVGFIIGFKSLPESYMILGTLCVMFCTTSFIAWALKK